MDTLKMLLGINDDSQNALLSFIIRDVRNIICGYCHTEAVPAQLESLVFVMAADLYRRKGYGARETPREVKAITEGERSISFENSVSTDDFLKEYEARLKPFKCQKGRVPSDVQSELG